MQSKQEYKIQAAKQRCLLQCWPCLSPVCQLPFFSSVWLVENPQMLIADEDEALYVHDDLAKMKI